MSSSHDESTLGTQLVEISDQYCVYIRNQGSKKFHHKFKSFDYVIVLEVEQSGSGFSDFGQFIVRQLKSLGFEMFAFYGICKTEIFLALKAPDTVLRKFANKIKFKMLLDPFEIEEELLTIDPSNQLSIYKEDNPFTHYNPFIHIYGRFDISVDEKIYWRPSGQKTPFRDLVRKKLTALLVESAPSDGGAPIKIRRYLNQRKILSYYPLHDCNITDEIERSWGGWSVRSVPIELLKEYFGEKIGLYCFFIQHYSKWLMLPSISGIPLQIVVVVLNDYSSPANCIYSTFFPVWSVLMLEYWKRKEHCKAMEWGTQGFEDTEQDRPDFKFDDDVPSFVTGKKNSKYFDPRKRRRFAIERYYSALLLLLLRSTFGITPLYFCQLSKCHP